MSRRTKLIVALHGAGMHAGVWGAMIGGLALPCQALSFPGHGRAEGALLPSIEQMAEWAAARLAGHPPHSVALMGHSMGALVALEAAARHKAVSALVLLGAAAQMPVHPELLYQAGENPEAATDMILKWGVSPVHPLAGAVRGMLKEQMKAAPGALLNDLKACHAYQGGAAAAKGVTVPALVISGMDDKLTRPEAGRALAEMMPRAQFHAFPDCGHMAMAEKPAEIAAEIGAFIEGVEA